MGILDVPNVTVVEHGSVASTPRPGGNKVLWYGSVYPSNLAPGDIYNVVSLKAIDPPLVYYAKYTAGALANGDLTTITSWADESGNARTLTQATIARRPQMNVAAGVQPAFVRFSGAQNMQTAAFTPVLAQPGTLCMAVRMVSVPTGSGVTHRLVDGLDALAEWVLNVRCSTGLVPQFQFAANTTTLRLDVAVAVNSWYVISFIPTGAGSGRTRINGVEVSSTVGLQSLGGLTFGSKFDSTIFSNFDLAAVRLAAGVMSPAQLTQTEQYLADLTGVTLPA